MAAEIKARRKEWRGIMMARITREKASMIEM
jgi:hypothetical protein